MAPSQGAILLPNPGHGTTVLRRDKLDFSKLLTKRKTDVCFLPNSLFGVLSLLLLSNGCWPRNEPGTTHFFKGDKNDQVRMQSRFRTGLFYFAGSHSSDSRRNHDYLFKNEFRPENQHLG